MRISPAAPKARHCSPAATSLAGSHALASFWPASFNGTLAKSPFGGVTMRKRQSSVMTATQLPVKSVGDAWRGVRGAWAAP